MAADAVIRDAVRRFPGSLQDLADRSGVTKSYLSKIKNGNSKRIGAAVQRKIAKALGIPESALADDAIPMGSLEEHPVLGWKLRQIFISYNSADPVSREWMERLLDVIAEPRFYTDGFFVRSRGDQVEAIEEESKERAR